MMWVCVCITLVYENMNGYCINNNMVLFNRYIQNEIVQKNQSVKRMKEIIIV